MEPGSGRAAVASSGPVTSPNVGGDGPVRTGSVVEAIVPAAADSSYREDPRLTLLSLALCLIGFIEIAAQLYALRFQGTGATFYGLPSRVTFVFGLTLAASPLFLAFFRRPIVLFVLPPIVLVFLLYPLFVPFGVPFGQDPIYNYQFALAILQSGHWIPGATAGVTNQAVAYSYYPASGVFDAEFAAFTGLPPLQAFSWAIPLLRLLVLPPAVFALGKRYFGARVGFGAVLLFLATPSILFNNPVQSEFAIPFFALLLVLLGYLVVDGRYGQVGLVAAISLLAAVIVMSHTLTSYTLGAWIGGLLLYWALSRGFPTRAAWRAGAVGAIYVLFLLGFTFWISLPQFLANYEVLVGVLGSLTQPGAISTSTATSIGQSFPLYQLVWTYLAFGILLLGSLVVLRRWYRTQHRTFTTPNLAMAIVAVIVTIPLIVTAFSFLSERIMEYGELFIAPAIAWLAVRWLSAASPPSPQTATGPRNARSRASRRGYAVTAVVLVLVVLVFTGGSLVPYSTRDQFSPPDELITESPIHIDPQVYQLGVWAHSHLTASSQVWGDYLTYSVFGGFGQFGMEFNQYALYNGTTIPFYVWLMVSLGAYVVVDKYMTTTTPQFPGALEPTAPLTSAQLEKFNDPQYFDLIYQDSTFTIYQVIAEP